MISYPFISQLFKNVLAKSKTIQGRFYVCPKMGNEINSDLLGEVLQQVNPGKEYPLVLMMPPRAIIGKNEWVDYSITLFFLKTTYYGTGNTTNEFTGTSTHTIEQDWTEMQTAVISFMNVLNQLEKLSMYRTFRFGERQIPIQPVSNIGIDRASGVRLDFTLSVSTSCLPFEDYETSDINSIEIPV